MNRIVQSDWNECEQSAKQISQHKQMLIISFHISFRWQLFFSRLRELSKCTQRNKKNGHPTRDDLFYIVSKIAIFLLVKKIFKKEKQQQQILKEII